MKTRGGNKATHPCPCGYLGDGTDRCHCGYSRVRQYRSRISGPLLDRFDMHIEVPQVAFRELAALQAQTSGDSLAREVRRARLRQLERGALNARLGERQIFSSVSLDRRARKLLADAQDRWQLSARSVVRILKLSRTLADLAERDQPGVDELSEALQLRRLDRPLSIDTV